jgi:hypothetical protein
MKEQTLPEALEYVWQDYSDRPPNRAGSDPPSIQGSLSKEQIRDLIQKVAANDIENYKSSGTTPISSATSRRVWIARGTRNLPKPGLTRS